MLMFGVKELVGAVESTILQTQTFKVGGEEIEEVGNSVGWQSCPLCKTVLILGAFYRMICELLEKLTAHINV